MPIRFHSPCVFVRDMPPAFVRAALGS